jgi:hypothetical protein
LLKDVATAKLADIKTSSICVILLLDKLTSHTPNLVRE